MGDDREPAGYKPGGYCSEFGQGLALSGDFCNVVCVVLLVEHAVARTGNALTSHASGRALV